MYNSYERTQSTMEEKLQELFAVLDRIGKPVVSKIYTVEPLKKGHVGDNINSLVLSIVER